MRAAKLSLCGPAWRLVERSCLRTARPFARRRDGAGRDIRGSRAWQGVAAIRNKDDADAARAVVESLLKRPLTADAAVQIALLNNRRLQAAYNELAVAEAELVQASLPPNPTFSLMRISGSGELEIERRIIADILGACDAACALRNRGGTFSSGAIARHRGNGTRRGRNAPHLVSRGRRT